MFILESLWRCILRSAGLRERLWASGVQGKGVGGGGGVEVGGGAWGALLTVSHSYCSAVAVVLSVVVVCIDGVMFLNFGVFLLFFVILVYWRCCSLFLLLLLVLLPLLLFLLLLLLPLLLIPLLLPPLLLILLVLLSPLLLMSFNAPVGWKP